MQKKGGWDISSVQYEPSFDRELITNYYKMLLDPLAWQAVGKTRGWKKEINEIPYHGKENIWVQYIHEFIGNIAGGDTIEEALETL